MSIKKNIGKQAIYSEIETPKQLRLSITLLIVFNHICLHGNKNREAQGKKIEPGLPSPPIPESVVNSVLEVDESV